MSVYGELDPMEATKSHDKNCILNNMSACGELHCMEATKSHDKDCILNKHECLCRIRSHGRT